MNAQEYLFKRRLLLKAVGLAGMAVVMPAAYAQLQVDILGVGANQFPISVEPFANNSEAPEDMAKIVGGRRT